ncbi:MAG: AAA family ATPase [Deltaproteobacteria bacterium]|nr:AAA family ATPase [Deltaproteobacteria bacterium]MBW2012464.1 AAA family ATPase [Deltaproteobacteria bacterium]
MLDDIFKLSSDFLKTFNKPYRRYFLDKYPLTSRFSIIIGQRGVGKTTAMIQKILSMNNDDIFTKNALYVPVDHFVVGGQSIYEIAEAFYNLGGEMICFDEIHKYTGWSGELKSIYDSFRKLTILASGSSAMEIQKGSHDLSRRAVVYPMTGLSFREYIDLAAEIKTESFVLKNLLEAHEKLSHDIITATESKKKKILALFKDYLQFGYFPYFTEFDDISMYYITLEQGIRTTIESDLLSIYPTLNGSSIKKIKKLLTVIAESAPFTPDLKRLKRIVEIGDERTLKNYLKYLEDGGVITSLTKSGSRLGSLEKPEKIYLNNTNQIYAISSKGKENIGNIRETFFINMLSAMHEVLSPKKGDFLIDNKYTFEIGGKNKSFKQIKDISNSFLAVDDIETGIGNKIPLWLFGFLY